MSYKIAARVLFAGSAAMSGTLTAQEPEIAVGSQAPAVTIPDLDGKPVNLGQYIGRRPLFLEFWATWCESCEELLPQVRAAQQAYGSDVEFFGINVTVNQTRDRVRRYVEQHKPPFRTLYDEDGVSTRAYQVVATSQVVIVDRTGKVAYTGTGGRQGFDPVLRRVAGK